MVSYQCPYIAADVIKKILGNNPLRNRFTCLYLVKRSIMKIKILY